MGGTQAWFGQWCKTHLLFTDYRQAFITQFIRHSDTAWLATFQNKTSLIMQCLGTTAIGTNMLKDLQDELNLFMFRGKKEKKKLLKGHLPFLGYCHLRLCSVSLRLILFHIYYYLKIKYNLIKQTSLAP